MDASTIIEVFIMLKFRIKLMLFIMTLILWGIMIPANQIRAEEIRVRFCNSYDFTIESVDGNTSYYYGTLEEFTPNASQFLEKTRNKVVLLDSDKLPEFIRRCDIVLERRSRLDVMWEKFHDNCGSDLPINFYEESKEYAHLLKRAYERLSGFITSFLKPAIHKNLNQ